MEFREYQQEGKKRILLKIFSRLGHNLAQHPSKCKWPKQQQLAFTEGSLLPGTTLSTVAPCCICSSLVSPNKDPKRLLPFSLTRKLMTRERK